MQSPLRSTDALSTALEALVVRFAAMVRSVGARHGLSDGDLDEIVQELRIRLWRAGHSGEQIERLGASYVYRAASSAALDLIRRRRARGGAHTESVDEHAEVLEAEGDATDSLAREELERHVVAALDALPLSRRTVVRLYLSGYEREEIAELLGWSEAKTRNLMYRGLADLRARLTEMGVAWGDR